MSPSPDGLRRTTCHSDVGPKRARVTADAYPITPPPSGTLVVRAYELSPFHLNQALGFLMFRET